MIKVIYKQGLLALCAVGLILAYLNIPFYKQWFKYKINYKYAEFFQMKDNWDYDYRMQYRFKDDYLINKYISSHFDTVNVERPIIFLPPKKYFARFENKYDWGESLMFYYFTGIKSTSLASNNYQEATHALLANEASFKIVAIENESILNLVVSEFEKYK